MPCTETCFSTRSSTRWSRPLWSTATTGRPRVGFEWFTHTYFHRPEESVQEAAEAGFLAPQVFAIEGSARALPDSEIEARLADPVQREHLMWALRLMETEPSVLGVSSHLLTLGRKG